MFMILIMKMEDPNPVLLFPWQPDFSSIAPLTFTDNIRGHKVSEGRQQLTYPRGVKVRWLSLGQSQQVSFTAIREKWAPPEMVCLIFLGQLF